MKTVGNEGSYPATILTNKGFFSFKLKSCKEAQIILTTGLDSTRDSTVTVKLGTNNNKQSVITTSNDEVTLNTDFIIDCDMYKMFWVSWMDGLVRLGTGLPYENEFMKLPVFLNISQNINKVKLSSGQDATADWLFRTDAGKTKSSPL